MHAFMVKCNGNLIFYVAFCIMYSVKIVNFIELYGHACLSMLVINGLLIFTL
jgi:hypothetical protein